MELATNRPSQFGSIVSAARTMMLTVSADGAIVDCDGATEQLLKRSRDEIMTRQLADIFPGLADVPLLSGEGVNARLKFRTRIGCRYDAVGANNERLSCMLSLNLLNGRRLTVIAEPVGSQQA